MVKLSTTFPDRTVCKYCFKPADLNTAKHYMSNIVSSKEAVKETCTNPKYLIPTDFYEGMINRSNFNKIKIGYVSYTLYSSTKVSYHKRFKNIIKGRPNNGSLPKIVFCPCGKTYWTDYSYSSQYVIENNRKSKI